jgi:flagellar biosynthesis/type III secretory pathway chaperone
MHASERDRRAGQFQALAASPGQDSAAAPALRSPELGADLQTTLLQLLHAERDALIAGDAAALQRVLPRKAEALQRLVGSNLSRSALEQLQRLNEQNARVATARLQAGKARLEALLQAGGTGTYSERGNVQAGPRPHGSTVASA